MTKYRKHILAAVFGAMLLFYVGDWLLDNVLTGPLQTRRAKTARLQREIKKKEDELARAREAGKRLAVWETQSLPSDTEVARSLYQAWLIELVDEVGLSSPSVNSGEPVSRKGMYHSMSFSVRGRGTLQQLTRFLFTFYRADLLHQIRTLNITPLGRSDKLDLSISIEALVLPEAGPKDRGAGDAEEDQETVFEEFRERAWRDSDRLASLNLADYHPIVRRNLFGVGGSPDATDHAYLTAVNYVDGQPQAWFTLRASDTILKLRKGEGFEIGQFAGTIIEIEGSDVVIESEGERWLLTLGENLAEAYALPPEF